MERVVVEMVFDWPEPMLKNSNPNCREKAAVKMGFDQMETIWKNLTPERAVVKMDFDSFGHHFDQIEPMRKNLTPNCSE